MKQGKNDFIYSLSTFLAGVIFISGSIFCLSRTDIDSRIITGLLIMLAFIIGNILLLISFYYFTANLFKVEHSFKMALKTGIIVGLSTLILFILGNSYDHVRFIFYLMIFGIQNFLISEIYKIDLKRAFLFLMVSNAPFFLMVLSYKLLLKYFH